jgi:hypothetical protein
MAPEQVHARALRQRIVPLQCQGTDRSSEGHSRSQQAALHSEDPPVLGGGSPAVQGGGLHGRGRAPDRATDEEQQRRAREIVGNGERQHHQAP